MNQEADFKMLKKAYNQAKKLIAKGYYRVGIIPLLAVNADRNFTEYSMHIWKNDMSRMSFSCQTEQELLDIINEFLEKDAK